MKELDISGCCNLNSAIMKALEIATGPSFFIYNGCKIELCPGNIGEDLMKKYEDYWQI